MRFLPILSPSLLHFVLLLSPVPVSFATPLSPSPGEQSPLLPLPPTHDNDDNYNHTSRQVSPSLYAEIEELSRLVDIAYCVGDTTGTTLSEPFTCPSRCSDFPSLHLIITFSTGVLLSDSCGYIAVDDDNSRIILAFRGSYSLSNAVVDLSTIPQKYEPYEPPAGGDDDDGKKGEECKNCTVHTGFQTSWRNTRSTIVDTLRTQISLHPSYTLTFVGHSLGGAVAALAGLEVQALIHHNNFTSTSSSRKALKPSVTVTTFGEPRLGNLAFAEYLNSQFDLLPRSTDSDKLLQVDDQRYRRLTHRNDPVPLLPLTEWGYVAHAGEIFIADSALPPTRASIIHCSGNNDADCLAGQDGSVYSEDHGKNKWKRGISDDIISPMKAELEEISHEPWGIPSRYKLWELFFAHRDYFWRLGLCVRGGDPFGGRGSE